MISFSSQIDTWDGPSVMRHLFYQVASMVIYEALGWLSVHALRQSVLCVTLNRLPSIIKGTIQVRQSY